MDPSSRPSDPAVWERLRTICDPLPLTTSKMSHGELTWSVGKGAKARQFATTWDHHHDDRNAIVFAAPPGAQQQLIEADPEVYFRPPYVGARGWVGMYLDTGSVDWDVLELHLTDAHAHLAPSDGSGRQGRS
jgi:hypothetical protein